MKRIAIIGSREYENKAGLQHLKELIDDWSWQVLPFVKLVSGGAKGIDTRAEELAKFYDLPVITFTPEAEIAGNPILTYKAACVIRDKKIVDYSDEVYAFWNEQSAGTIHGIKRAYETGKPITVIGNEGQEMTREQVEARFAELGKPMPKPKQEKTVSLDL